MMAVTRYCFLIATVLLSSMAALRVAAAPLPMQATEFPSRASGLVDREVEIFGDLYSPPLINKFAIGKMHDRQTGKAMVSVIFDKADSQTVKWMAKNMCRQTCRDVFIRGRIVSRREYREPVLEMTDISFASMTGQKHGGDALAQTVSKKDRYGVPKPVLPPGTVPMQEGWRGWAERVPASAPGYDAAKGMWGSMTAMADYRRQADWDSNMSIIRGPSRPDDFETYYRGVRDTGLAMLFKAHQYNGVSTAWPRVALIVEDAPANAAGMASEYWQHGKTKQDICWRLRAKVWAGPARSEDIAPFNWCLSETRFNVTYAGVARWGAAPKSNMMHVLATTGKERTEGPNPPNTPLPDKRTYRSQFSYATIMTGNVLMDMGFNYNLPDGRVWLVDDQPR